MLKSIFWDNDGVLVDTERLYYLANKSVFESIGIELTKKMYLEYFLIKGTGAWHLTKDYGFSQSRLEELRNTRDALFSQMISMEKMLFEGVRETLSILSEKYRMSIITGSRRDHFDLIHRTTNILHFFDFVLTAEDFTKYKPDPQPYNIALQRSGLKKEECIIIEDTERGLASAAAAGIKCIVIPHELSREGNFSTAYKILSSISSLPGILSEI